ncbi:MAG: phenylacetate--CoA ligase [Clostridia bacterium]|nr:phenylacetate--CoA ligase [Clostridia bacterium]
MIWNPGKECLSRKEYDEIKLERLKWTVKRAYENVKFYRDRFDKIGLKPEHIQTLKDIEKIPYTSKLDLRENYPFKLFAEPMSKIVRLHASSGTTGKPVVFGYTKNDMDVWKENISRIAAMAGVTNDDIAQIVFGFGMFTGGFGLYQGLENMGVTVVPASSGNSERQLMFIEDFGVTVLVGTPSYVLHLGELVHERNLQHKVRVGLFGGEGHTAEMRRQIERLWGIECTENYGLTEVQGPGVSGECLEHDGMHINEDSFLFEIIDSDTLEVKNPEEEGELVLTTLTKEGVPVLRYRTKDITSINFAPCKCGRTSARMAKVKGRSDDMLIIKGVNVFPSQIESLLLGMPHIGPHYELIVTKKGYMDQLEVKVELADAALLEKYAELEALTNKIREKVRSNLLIDAKITLAEPKTLERYVNGKAKRVHDLRNQ